MFSQTRPDILELLVKVPFRGAGAERLAAVDGGGDSYPGPPADAFGDPRACPCNRGYDVARQQEVGASNPYHAVAAFANQAASTPGPHGVPFNKRGPATGLPVPQGTPRGSGQGTATGENAGSATLLPGLPEVDAPRQERAAFFSKHKICLAFRLPGCVPARGVLAQP